MEKKTLLGFVLLLLAFSANFQTISSQTTNCYDSCNMGCVNRDNRLYLRCDKKCQIRCSQDLRNAEQLEKISGLDNP